VATAGPALRPARGRPSLHGLDATTTALIAVGASLLAVALCLNALAIVASRPAVLPILAVGAIGIAAMLVQPAWIFPALVGLTWSSLGTAVLGGLPSPIEVGALAFLVVALIRAAKRPALSREALLVCALFGLPVVIAAFTARSDAALAVVPDLGKDLVFLFLVALCVVSLRDVQRVAMALTSPASSSAQARSTRSWSARPASSRCRTSTTRSRPRGRSARSARRTSSRCRSPCSCRSRSSRSPAAAGSRCSARLTAVLLTGGVLAAGSRGGLLTIARRARSATRGGRATAACAGRRSA
jgi:hypothetical protein